MMERPQPNSEMSETRAQEIIDFIENGTPAQFGNVNHLQTLQLLAEKAYSSTDREKPDTFNDLLRKAKDRLIIRRKRLGLDIGNDRAQHLVSHLLGKEINPHFRECDTIQTKRALFRKALATVAQTQETVSDNSHHHLVANGEVLVEDKYPLVKDDGSN